MTPGTEELPTEMGALAEKLSEAQRDWLTEKAQHRELYNDGIKRWATFPPSNTHRVLHQLGLVMAIGFITDLGLALRAHLQANPIPTSDSKDAGR